MNLIDRRLGLLFAAFIVLLALVVVRAVWIQGISGGSLSAEAQSQQTETVEVPGSRGTIYDRNGSRWRSPRTPRRCSPPRTRSRTRTKRRTSSARSWMAPPRRTS